MQTVYHASFISTYNVLFTSLPPIVVGILEQDVGAKNCLRFPFLYEAGPRNILFTTKAFYLSLLRGTWHSLVLFFVWHGAVSGGGNSGEDGLDEGGLMFQAMGLAWTLVVLANIELAVESDYITWMSAVFYVLGLIAYIVVFGVLFSLSLTSPPDAFTLQTTAYGSYTQVLGSATFWGAFFVTLALTNIFSFIMRFCDNYFNPTPTAIVREKLMLRKTKSIDPKPFTEIERPDSWDRSRCAHN